MTMQTSYNHAGDVWAIHPAAYQRACAMVQANPAAQVPENAGQPRQRKQKSIAVLELRGILEPRLSLMGWLFGGTSTMAFGREFDAAVADPGVSSILLDVDSPGGSVFGMQELSDKIYNARGTKPIIAIANPQADSAAYYAATAADRLYVTPSGRVGSVGTMTTHLDLSGMYEQAGAKEYLIRADDSPHKGEWLESQPVTEEYLADLQKLVNEYQSAFTASVARNRGVTPAEVRAKFGKGRDVGSRAAIEAGMADRIATFDDVLARMTDGRIRLGATSAADSWDGTSRFDRERRNVETLALAAESY